MLAAGLDRLQVVAAFHDLGNRVGIQAHLGHDSHVGHSEPEEGRYEINYALALTKTLTEERRLLSYFTMSLEVVGETQLDGETSGRTPLSLLPGMQWEFRESWWFSTAIEVPLSDPRPFDEIWHMAVYKEF